MGDEWLRANAAISFVLYVKLHCIVPVGVFSLSMLPCTVTYTHPAVFADPQYGYGL